MMFFGNITSSNLITFEGGTVERIDLIQDKKSKEITHYRLAVVSDDGNIELRKICVEEISHLLENEILVIDRGYRNRQRQMDRAIYGLNELSGATKAQREKADLMVFRSSTMKRYHAMGMKLTRTGVEDYRPLMEADYRSYQARENYET